MVNGNFESYDESRKLFIKEEIVIAVVGMAFGLYFLSPGVTGNVVGDLETHVSNIFGIAMLVIALIAGYFWVRKRRK
jgi:LPXTG-motif cell wall-anchored protein